MKLVKQILFSKKNNTQIIFSTIGALIGLMSLLSSVLLLNDVNNFKSTDKELFGENNLIIQKRVTKLTTLGLNKTTFYDDEIDALENMPFIKKIAPFTSASYAVGISDYPGDGLPHFYADMFFQSIPDEFIDVDAKWEWTNEEDIVPIILPRDFLMLVNYGVAESQGLPQISEDLLAIARLKIEMKGKTKKGEIKGKVVGFSHKISSILVPQSFLDFSNNKYGVKSDKKPQRLFITIEDGSYGQLEDIMDDMNLDIDQSALDITKITTYVNVIISVFLVASVIIILLSIFGFIQYVQLVLNKSKTEITILFRLGYGFNTLLKVLLSYFAIVFGSLTLIAVVLVLSIKKILLNPMLENNGIEVVSNELLVCIFLGLVSFLIFMTANFLSIKTTLKRMNT